MSSMIESIKKIVNKAVTAPSGDNSQPWWFHIVSDDTIEVNLYPKKDNQILNYELSGTHIAIGALIENIIILATTEKLLGNVELFPDQTNSNLVARINFTESDIKEDDLANFTDKRCTNRKPYKNTAISEEILSDIKGLGKDVLITTDKKNIKQLADASSIMEKVALETEAIHKLFFESIVWNEKEEQEKGMGLPIKTTELPPPVQLLFRAIKHWNINEKLNRIGLSFLASKANAQTYATSAAIGIVVANHFDKYEYVKAGRSFQRAWLTATKHGLAFQPVTGLLFLAQRVLANKTEVFHTKHIPQISSAYDVVTTKFDLNEGIPAMLFRMGYADAPSARTIRRPAEFR